MIVGRVQNNQPDVKNAASYETVQDAQLNDWTLESL